MIRPVLAPIPLASPALFLALTWRNGGVDWRRLPVFGGLLLRYTAADPVRLLQHVVYNRAIEQHALSEDPIFVIGHWRSGTSWLQALLALDPRFTTTTLYNTLFADISELTEGWLKPAMNATARMLGMPHNLQRAPLHLDLPGEGDVGLYCQLSPYAYTWGHIFPRHFEQWLDRCVLSPSPQTTTAWLAHLDRYLRKLSLASGGKRVVMKSPGDTGRIALLARAYPNAKFVFIHRDPIAVFHSNRYLWGVIRSEFSVQTLDDAHVDGIIERTYAALMRNYIDQRDAVGPGQLVEVSFEDLRTHPEQGLAGIYEALDLGPLPDSLASALAEQPAYSSPSYETPVELQQHLREVWGFAFDEWRSDP